MVMSSVGMSSRRLVKVETVKVLVWENATN
jgi:hypothetical protein